MLDGAGKADTALYAKPANTVTGAVFSYLKRGDVVQLVRTLPYNSVSPISLYTSSIYIVPPWNRILTEIPVGVASVRVLQERESVRS